MPPMACWHYTVNLLGGTRRERLEKPLIRGDSAYTLRVTWKEGDNAAALAAVNAQLWAVRADGASVLCSASLANNEATGTLHAEALAVVGRVSLLLCLSYADDRRLTPLVLDGHVSDGRTDAVVDPGSVIPSLEALLAQVDAARAATTAASSAAQSANNAAQAASSAAQAANDAAQAASSATQAAGGVAAKLDGMTVSAVTLPTGTAAQASVMERSGHKHVHFGIPKGDSGKDGVVVTVGAGMYALAINGAGHLVVSYPDAGTPPPLSLTAEGHLVYTL